MPNHRLLTSRNKQRCFILQDKKNRLMRSILAFMGRLKRLFKKLLLAKSNFVRRRFKRPIEAKN